MTEPDVEPEHEWKVGDRVTVYPLIDPTTGRTVMYLVSPENDDTVA
jgi:hypothetical protein